MRNLLISTSMLSANFTVLGEEVKSLEAAGADWLHWDCMDGHFTDQLTHGPIVLKALRPMTNLFFDAHLMITNPGPQIPLFAEAGADGISIHLETTDEPARLLDEIRARGCKSCLTVNPPTPLDDIERLLPHCDVIMLMGVTPGYAGQSYQPETTDRIRQVRALIDKMGLPTLIEVDGGVNGSTADEVIRAGADVLVSASFVFKHPDGYGGAIRHLRAIAAGL